MALILRVLSASTEKVEIDEYRDYEKALGALSEAVKQLTKAGSTGDKLTQLNKRVFLVERYGLAFDTLQYVYIHGGCGAVSFARGRTVSRRGRQNKD